MFGPVLGIDPGVSRCGFGAVVQDGSRLRAVSAGVIRTPAGDPLPDRLAALQAELETLVAEIQPTAVAVERVFFQVNVRTAMSVGQASGLALAVAARAGVPVFQYTPNEVKQAVAGYGAAGKTQVQAMVTKLLRLAEAPRPPDRADALALAICHLSAARLRARVDVVAGSPGAALPGLARAIAAAVAGGPTGAGGPTRIQLAGAASGPRAAGGPTRAQPPGAAGGPTRAQPPGAAGAPTRAQPPGAGSKRRKEET